MEKKNENGNHFVWSLFALSKKTSWQVPSRQTAKESQMDGVSLWAAGKLVKKCLNSSQMCCFLKCSSYTLPPPPQNPKQKQPPKSPKHRPSSYSKT